MQTLLEHFAIYVGLQAGNTDLSHFCKSSIHSQHVGSMYIRSIQWLHCEVHAGNMEYEKRPKFYWLADAP